MEKKWKQLTDFIFLSSKITAYIVCSHEFKRLLLLGRKAMTKLDSVLKKQRHHFSNKGLHSQSYGFSSSHVRWWELDSDWTLKNWCLNCGAKEDSWESLGCKEIKPVNPKGDQCWICIGRTVAEAEAPILWPPNVKSWKDPDAGKNWGQQEKRMTEDEMVR